MLATPSILAKQEACPSSGVSGEDLGIKSRMPIEQCFPAWLLCCSDLSVLATGPVLIPESGEGKGIVVKESKQLTVPWGMGIEELDLGLVDGEILRKVSVAFFLCEKVILFCCYISIKGRLFVCFGFPMPICSLNLNSDFVL